WLCRRTLVWTGFSSARSRSGRCQQEPLVALVGNIAVDLAVVTDSTHIRHEHARLTRNVRADVPGVGQREQGCISNLVDMRDPSVFRFWARFDGLEVMLPQ